MSEFLSNLAFYRTYSKTLPDGSKETWEQTVLRYQNMMETYYPELSPLIECACRYILRKQIVPSMRLLQFAGEPVYRDNARAYNCACIAADSLESFGEFIYLLMCGCGVGYSVQQCHISKLPTIQAGYAQYWQIPDSREGWADSIKQLLSNPLTQFDYSLIRQKGAPISTGGTSSGPEVLENAHGEIKEILRRAIGRKLSAQEISDIFCICADFVFVGGVRRAACIGLYDQNDNSMQGYKSGQWWTDAPFRAFVNVSAVLNPDSMSQAQFNSALQACFDSGTGEPGIILNRNPEKYGNNPCNEVSLRYNSFCNLTEVVAPNCGSKAEFLQAVQTAAILGTLQAGLTDFNYLRPEWKHNCEEEALLGVSITGLAQEWHWVRDCLSLGSMMATKANEETAALIGINPAARVCTVKPSGTTSAVMGCSSGIHAAHAPYYLRNVRITKDNPVAQAIMKHQWASPLLHDEGDQICITVPVEHKAAIYKDAESAVGLLDRMKWASVNWIRPGHRSGPNPHNVSLTCYYKPEEQEAINTWMWENRDFYNGVALFPKVDLSEGYVNLPFENVSREQFDLLKEQFEADFGDFNWEGIDWSEGRDERQQELACAGGSCELK